MQTQISLGELLMVALASVAGFLGGCGAAAHEMSKVPRYRWTIMFLSYGLQGAAIATTVPFAILIMNVDLSVYSVVALAAIIGSAGSGSSVLLNMWIKTYFRSRGMELREIPPPDDENR